MTILIITQSLSVLLIALLLIWRHERTKIIRRQDQDALKQNLTIQEKDKFIEELISKYGLEPKAKQKFKQQIEEALRKQRLDKSKN